MVTRPPVSRSQVLGRRPWEMLVAFLFPKAGTIFFFKPMKWLKAKDCFVLVFIKSSPFGKFYKWVLYSRIFNHFPVAIICQSCYSRANDFQEQGRSQSQRGNLRLLGFSWNCISGWLFITDGDQCLPSIHCSSTCLMMMPYAYAAWSVSDGERPAKTLTTVVVLWISFCNCASFHSIRFKIILAEGTNVLWTISFITM